MAPSGPPTPPPPPPGYTRSTDAGYQGPPATLAHAVCGPLLLITLGVLLAEDAAGPVSFGRTWPVLLIVFGICKLVDFMSARTN
jgi:hypothetical protein